MLIRKQSGGDLSRMGKSHHTMEETGLANTPPKALSAQYQRTTPFSYQGGGKSPGSKALEGREIKGEKKVRVASASESGWYEEIAPKREMKAAKRT